MRKSSLLILAATLACSNTYATLYNWVGPAANTGGNWSVNSNWSPSGIPNQISDDAHINSLAVTPTVTLDSQDITVFNLFVTDNAPTFTIDNSTSSPSSGYTLTANSIFVDQGSSNTAEISCPVHLGPSGGDSGIIGTLINPVNSTDLLTISGNISNNTAGTSQLYITSNNAGTVNLTGTNTYTGGTLINNSNVTGNTSGLQGNIAFSSSGTLGFNQVGLGTFNGSITGPGSVLLNTGTVTFNGFNSYTGGTTIALGATAFGDQNSLQGSFANDGNITFDTTISDVFAGSISGSGNLNKRGTGDLTLINANTYTGATTINNGTVFLQGNGDFGSTSVLTLSPNPPLSTVGLDISGINASSFGIKDFNTESGTSINLGDRNLSITPTFPTPIPTSISGIGGSLTLNGSSFILQGNNTYTGGTILNNATATVTNPNALAPTGDVSLSNSTLSFFHPLTIANLNGDSTSIIHGFANDFTTNYSTTSAFNGNFNSTGNFTISKSTPFAADFTLGGTNNIGSGTLTIQNAAHVNIPTGASFATTGPVNVNGSSLITVNGAISGGGSMTIDQSSMLKGTGTITKNVNIQGHLAPGNSIGTINLIGNQTLAPTSTLEIELSPTSIDLVNVTGNLALQTGSTVHFIPEYGIYPSPVVLDFVNVSGTLSGTFTHVITDLPLFSGNLVYNANSISFVGNFVPFTAVAQKQCNAYAAAKALDAQPAPVPGSDLATIISTLQFLPTAAQINEALTQLQPSQFTGIAIAQEDNTLYVRNAVYNHLQVFHRGRSCPLDCCYEGNEAEFWITGLTAHTSECSHHCEPGFRANTPGFVAGLDYLLCPDTRVGVSVAYTDTDLDWKHGRGHADISSTYGALYGRWDGCCAFLQGSLMGAYSKYHTNRHIEFGTVNYINRHAKGNHDGYEGSAHIKGGLIGQAGNTFINPYIALDYIYLHEDGFKEHGAGSLNLKLKDRNSDLLSSEIGLDFSHPFCCGSTTVTPYLEVSLIRESRFTGKHVKSHLGNAPMTASGFYPSRTIGGVVAGLDLTYCNGTLSLFYQGRGIKNFYDQSFYAQVTWAW